MFIAVHYVRINGTMYAPGETITENIAPDKEARLLDKGAIRIAAEAPFPAPQTEAEGFVDVDEKGGTEGDSGAESEVEPIAAEDEADEEYEEAEPMEIDATESITTAEEPPVEEEKKPSRKRRGGKESKA